MSSTDELYQIADELRAAASMGLIFASNGYEKDRNDHILKLSARLVATIEDRPAEEVYAQFSDTLLHLSPLAGVEVAAFRDDKLLLIQRRDDELWALPGGLCEVGETLAQAAERELWEETGVRGHVTQLLGIFDSKLWQTRSKVHLYTAIFQAELETGATPNARPDDSVGPRSETLAAGFFAEHALPKLSQGHHLRVPLIFRMQRGEIPVPYFDGKK